ncbi:DUF421 domain-containing protein [Aneurinibacillus tyrosinisolvens]|uniref:DUF421 domain-containing protein n=1 Tax=Aneurinibacillus tyrosinisolvens TaxID=1443435 RepID=UPI00063F1F36|nr:DUF421 domain-containing protein [Aneurinibacillus tyrosinisolvens]
MADTFQVILRSFFALIALFVITRLMGKKQLAQLTFFEYIAGITLGSIVAFISTDLEGNLVHGYASLLVWSTIPLLIEYISVKSRTARGISEGKGTVFIKNGKIMEDNLKKENYTTDELLEELRLKNVFKVADVEFAVLETNGQLSVMKKRDAQPVTLKDLKIKAAPERESQAVIMDGKVMLEPLATAGFNVQWLNTELEKIGVTLDNVFLGQVDSYGQLTLDLYDDKITVAPPTQQQLLQATLKKCQADLELFALSTQTTETKKLYEKASQDTAAILQAVSPFLR